MKQEYGEIEETKFGPLGYKWNSGDRIVLVMYDATHLFGKFSQSSITVALKKAPGSISLGIRNRAEVMAERALRQLALDAGLKYSDCKAKYTYLASVQNSYLRRHYVYVVGQDFLKMKKVGFKPFDHKGDLTAQLKEPNARVIKYILGQKLPSMSLFENAA